MRRIHKYNSLRTRTEWHLDNIDKWIDRSAWVSGILIALGLALLAYAATEGFSV